MTTTLHTKLSLPEFPIEYGKLVFPHPHGTVAGVVTTLPETILRFAKTGIFGFITSKSTGPARPGNREPIIGWGPQNAVGLSNAGVEHYSQEMKSIFAELADLVEIGELETPPVIVESIFEGYETAEPWVKAANLMVDSALSSKYSNILVELNFSCPHSKGYGSDVCADSDIRGAIVKDVKKAVKVPVFAKVGPWDKEIFEWFIPQLEESGADGIVACNTKLHDPIYDNGYPIITNGMGGVSGDLLLEDSLNTCHNISQLTDLPMIVMGGIKGIKQVERYRETVKGNQILGYGIGTNTAGMGTPKLLDFFSKMNYDYQNRKYTASRLVDTRKMMHYEMFRITESHGTKTKSVYMKPLNKDLIGRAQPGQWFFVGTVRNTRDRGPTFEEKPFSVAGSTPLKFVIKDRGLLTHELVKLKEGDEVKIKGIRDGKIFAPYGKGLSKSPSYLIAGGTGIAPINFTAELSKSKPIIFYGAENEEELVLLDNLKKNSNGLAIATLDGSYKGGYKGTVVDALEQYIDKMRTDASVFVCGPEKMMENVIKILKNEGFNLDDIYCSIERQCECGIGICGKCGFDGDRTCVDGTIYTARQLIEEHPSFGNWRRNKQGLKVYLK